MLIKKKLWINEISLPRIIYGVVGTVVVVVGAGVDKVVLIATQVLTEFVLIYVGKNVWLFDSLTISLKHSNITQML